MFLALSHMGQLCSSEQSSSSGQSHVSSCSDSESDCGFAVFSFVEEFSFIGAAEGSFFDGILLRVNFTEAPNPYHHKVPI